VGETLNGTILSHVRGGSAASNVIRFRHGWGRCWGHQAQASMPRWQARMRAAVAADACGLLGTWLGCFGNAAAFGAFGGGGECAADPGGQAQPGCLSGRGAVLVFGLGVPHWYHFVAPLIACEWGPPASCHAPQFTNYV
jgi:hypothetical protein